jgi:hypothetical protein
MLQLYQYKAIVECSWIIFWKILTFFFTFWSGTSSKKALGLGLLIIARIVNPTNCRTNCRTLHIEGSEHDPEEGELVLLCQRC